MKVVCGILLLFLLFSASVQQAQLHWDFLLLVQQWGPSFCASQKSACITPPPMFTLHGLWPSNITSRQPADCGPPLYDITAVQPLASMLHEYWPNLKAGNSDSSFWEYEYNKHGTCARSLPSLAGTYNFFDTTLNLRSTYDVTPALQSVGLTKTSAPIYAEQVTKAVRAAYGVDPVLRCAYEVETGYPLLLEIGICISKSLKAFQCDSRVYTEGSSPCPSSFYIRPPHVGGDGDGGEVAMEVIFPLLFVFVVLAACVGAAVGYRYWRRRQNNEHQFEQL